MESQLIPVEMEELGPDDFFIWLMPWCDLRENIDFGNIKVWDYFRQPENFLTSANFKRFMPSVADSFKTSRGQSKESLFIISDTAQSVDGRSERTRWAARAILFCYVAGLAESFVLGEIDSLPFMSSERFTPYAVNIVEGLVDDYETGSDMLISLDSFRRYEPPALAYTCGYPNRVLLSALARLNDGFPHLLNSDESKQKVKERRKLWLRLETVFDWFANAWTLGRNVNMQTRFISMMIAFEAFARRDGGDLRVIPDLASSVARKCKWTNLGCHTNHTLHRKDKNNEERIEHITEPEMWIHEFAKIRNKLAHGQFAPWGRISFETEDRFINPITAMTMVVNELVYANLLDAKVLDKDEMDYLKGRRKRIIKALGWTDSSRVTERPSSSWLKVGDHRCWRYLFEDVFDSNTPGELRFSGTQAEFVEWQKTRNR